MKIRNKQVKNIYDRWNLIWQNTEQDERIRIKAFSIIQVIEALVCIYELQEELDQDTIDDLFISWGDIVKPLFPEDFPELRKRLTETIKQMEKNNSN